ncbi:RND family efflux transporter, MFP subunit [Desulfocapsa sulfexigens DSM 10523]|uniref:RND family efflux transporter, MFP subunit n=1 Tax=Desulfocapsa sulfexigens (strain DSM 10523 / SB164P1) TaxID=1167006 RepID=M1P6F0_DESSD|nr:efflux RND transporter periplasmic adaptor subunit [Desulfocapsa sulfexigens]AGF79013.1 RND family efflux transporter, MFP subunit [Desulfocapsa sulfexigens DSM 10523]
MKKFCIAFCTVFFAVTALISGGCSSEQPTDTQTVVPVSKHDFNIELNIVGVLDAAKSHMIASELEGTNGTIIYLINDGKSVVKGETVVRFDRALFEKEVTELEAQVESYTAAVEAAEQVVAFEINQVEKELVNARYGQSVASLELKRLEEGDGPLKLSGLMEERQKVQIELKRFQDFLTDLESFEKKGFKNPSEISSTKEKIAAYNTELSSVTKRYETYKNNVLPVLIESAKAKVQNAEMLVQQTREGGKHKIAKTRATLLQVKAMLKTQKSSLEKARLKLSKTEIVAPFDGIVIHYQTFRNGEKRKPREGDSVFMNQPILYLPDITRMVIKTKAREVDLHKIKLGQRGTIVVDAYPDAKLSGELTFVGSLAAAEESGESYEKYFQVLFKVNEEDTRLRPGMTCRISIQAESVTDAIAVPLQAVFTHDQDMFCYVKTEDGGFEARSVVIGRQNEEFVEILEGLTVGEQVSLIRQSL